MSVRELGRRLGLSPSLVSRLIRRGMPADSEQAAREWRARCIRLRARPARVVRSGPTHREQGLNGRGAAQLGTVTELGAEQLEDTIPRLRHLEKSLALAAERAFKNDKIAEAISLRREHVAAIKALYDAESKLIKINEARGRLVSLEKALGLVNDAMQSAILVLRQLPQLARDPQDKQKLEAFLAAVLSEIKFGAANGLKHAA